MIHIYYIIFIISYLFFLPSAKFYQKSQEKHEKKLVKGIKFLLKTIKTKSNNMFENNIRISQKMKNESQLSIQKKVS